MQDEILKNRTKNTILQEADKNNVRQVNIVEQGATGTDIFSGYISEEYLTSFEMQNWPETVDKMRRSDTQIAMCLNSVKNAITGGLWSIEAAEEVAKSEDHAEFIKFILFQDIDRPFKEKLREILTFIDFGFSIFERVHKVVKGHKKYGDYVGIEKLAFRSQKTIQAWHIDKMTRKLFKVEQLVNGDTIGLNNSTVLYMFAKDLLLFTIDQEGDNFEGISMLRQCYGAWFRKRLYEKLQAIGIEKSAIGIPIGKYPANQYGSSEFTALEDALKSLTSHQKNYIMTPNGDEKTSWNIEILKIDFDAEKIKEAIEFQNIEMVRRFIAQFLMLGSGESGSWSLSTDQSDFFLNGITFIADLVAEVFNKLIKELIKINFGEQDDYPKLVHSGIKDKAGLEYAQIISMFKEKGLIRSDDILEEHLREKFKLPKIDFETVKENVNPLDALMNKQEEQKDEEKEEVEEEEEEEEKKSQDKKSSEIKLAEGSKETKKINKYSQMFVDLYNNVLKPLAYEYVDDIAAAFKKSSDRTEIDLITKIQFKGQDKYHKELKKVFNIIITDATDYATEKVSKAPKLSEIKLAEKYNKKNKLLASTMAATYSKTQIADLEKSVIMAYGNIQGTTEDSKILKQGLLESADKDIKNKINAATLSSSTAFSKAIVNVYFDDEIKQEIESFTFRNDAPVSAICIDLNGRTFSVDDAASQAYIPPLHHNCKSYIEPNFRAAKNNPDISNKGLVGGVNKNNEKNITLKEVSFEN